jgi:HEAT repeat protein
MMKDVYGILAQVGDATVDLAMAEALPTADPRSQIKLVLSMLRRGHQPALAGIIRHFHLLPKALKEKVLEDVSELEPGIRIIAAVDQDQVGMNLIQVIVRARRYHLSYLLSMQLQKDSPGIQRAAAAGLLELSWGLRVGEESKKPDVASHVVAMGNALAEGLSSYHKHHQHIVLMAAASLATSMPPRLIKMLSDRLSTPYAHLRQILPRMDHPLINRALLCYAGIPDLRPVVVEALRSRSVVKRLPDILQGSHLLILPAVRVAVRKVTSADHLLPTDEAIKKMDMDTARRVPRWISTLHADSHKKAAALGGLIATDDKMLRLLALRALMRIGDRPSDDRVVTMCLDKDPMLARIALRHLVWKNWVGLARLMGLLVDSEHEDIRQSAERYLISMGFDRLWERWDRLNIRMRVLAGVTLIRANPNFYRQLSLKLRHPDHRDRLKAIMMIRQLKLPQQFRNELLRLIHDESPRTASASVGALGPLSKPPRLKRMLVELLEHPNDRIRANAVEALAQSGDLVAAHSSLRQLAVAGTGNRSRATAIWALGVMGDAQANDRLSSMLADARSRHRLSAIWVVQKLAIRQMVPRLKQIVESDSESSIRMAAENAIFDVHETKQVDSSTPDAGGIEA